MMKYLAVMFCVGVTALAVPTLAQSDAEIEAELAELCKTTLCRAPTLVRLNLEDGEVFEMTPGLPTPIIAGDLVTVYPGETVWIEAEVEAGRLVGLRAVTEVSKPKQTLTFTLTQEPSLENGVGMLLQVKGPFNGVLKYTMGMMLPTGDGLFKTSACPLHGGRVSFESWPHPIFQIVATDFRLVDPQSDAASRCE